MNKLQTIIERALSYDITWQIDTDWERVLFVVLYLALPILMVLGIYILLREVKNLIFDYLFTKGE